MYLSRWLLKQNFSSTNARERCHATAADSTANAAHAALPQQTDSTTNAHAHTHATAACSAVQLVNYNYRVTATASGDRQ